MADVAAPAPTSQSQIGTSAPYARRKITLTFQLGAGNFRGTGANKVTIEGLRVHFQATQVNMPSPSQAVIRVFGLTLEQINQLTQAGTQFYVPANRQNEVLVQAGDWNGGPLTTVWKGKIYEAYPEFNSMPETAFVILANPAFDLQLTPVAPISFPGTVQASQVFQQIAQQAGITVVNNGVKGTFQSPYFPGNVWQQLRKAVQAANCFAWFDGANNRLVLYPKSGGTSQAPLKTISPATGMIGFPEFMHARIRLRVIFDPSLQAVGPSYTVQVNSQLTAANGPALVNQVDYDLESENPGGSWEMIVTAVPLAVAQQTA